VPTSSVGLCAGWCALTEPGRLGQGVGYAGISSGAARREMRKSFGYPHPCLAVPTPPSCGPPSSSWEAAVSAGVRGTGLLLPWQLAHVALAFCGLARGTQLCPWAQQSSCLAPLGGQVRESLCYCAAVGCCR